MNGTLVKLQFDDRMHSILVKIAQIQPLLARENRSFAAKYSGNGMNLDFRLVLM